MATTTNYSWTTPDDTALVKDGASAIRTLGSSADTTTKNLNPSTTLGDIEFRSSTSNVNTRLGIGSTGNVLTVASGVPSWAAPAGGTTYSIFRDEKTSGTNGGTFTSGAFRTRDINATQVNQITGSSIASNQITLPAGTFYISASAPSFNNDQNQARFFNITDSSVAILGTSDYQSTNDQGSSIVLGTIVLTSSKVFELQHQCVTTQASNGFGVANTFGTQVYSVVTIAKVA